jgi:hypothetical protein
MNTKNQLNVHEKLLLAAYELEENNRTPFSAEDLVVAAWQKFPATFGLSGYADDSGKLRYPDSNRVFAEIMGAKPIRKRGLLVKVGKKMYQLTEAGREVAKDFSDRLKSLSPEKVGLSREIQRELIRLLSGRATQKFRNSRSEEMTFHDACGFWRISPWSSAIQLEGRLAHFESVVDTARRAFRERTVSFKHGGRTYNGRDLDVLEAVHRDLMSKFSEEIEAIMKRTDERA